MNVWQWIASIAFAAVGMTGCAWALFYWRFGFMIDDAHRVDATSWREQDER